MKVLIFPLSNYIAYILRSIPVVSLHPEGTVQCVAASGTQLSYFSTMRNVGNRLVDAGGGNTVD